MIYDDIFVALTILGRPPMSPAEVEQHDQRPATSDQRTEHPEFGGGVSAHLGGRPCITGGMPGIMGGTPVIMGGIPG